MDLSQRCDNLSWTHHREVAALKPEKQTHWLERAKKDSLSVRDLRQLIQPKPAEKAGPSKEFLKAVNAIAAGSTPISPELAAVSQAHAKAAEEFEASFKRKGIDGTVFQGNTAGEFHLNLRGLTAAQMTAVEAAL